MTREQVAAGFTETRDPYTGDSSFSGPFFSTYYNNIRSTRSDVSMARGVFSGKGENPYFIFSIWATEWYFLKRVYVMDYGEVNVMTKSRDVRTGEVVESIAFVLPKSLIISRKDSGIHIRLDGDKGDIELMIPSYYIQGYLDALDR